MACDSNDPQLWMGQQTFPIPMELFALNRRRLVKRLNDLKVKKRAVVLLQGGKDVSWYDTDVSFVFKQESYFMWAFGVLEPDCYGIIEVDTGESHLLVPELSETHEIWMGRLRTLDEIAQKYQLRTHYSHSIMEVLSEIKPSVILTMKGTNSDSGLSFKSPQFDGIELFNIETEILYKEIADLRVIKTEHELAVIKYVVEVSSAAHRQVMKNIKTFKYEYQCESSFLHYAYSVGGCRHASYTCICAGGANGAILHYGHAGAPNNGLLKEGTMCCFDMGANYFGYCADITCSFPVNGRFTTEQRDIYNAVLAANLAVAKAGRPGVHWTDMHLLANSVLLEKLKDLGLVVGDIQEMIDAGVANIFQPHGLGHLLGLDVHDVGGYLPNCPPKIMDPPGINNLRTARTLQKHMVLTIEPGCYFNEPVLERSYKNAALAKYLVPAVINKYKHVGGIRIEDDVVVTSDGIVNLTKVPRTVDDIENWMAERDTDQKYI